MRVALALALVMASAGTAAADHQILYLNRCVGGCTVHPSGLANNSHSDTSACVGDEQSSWNVSEFQWADAVWDQVVACVRDVYAPYDVEVTDVDPGDVEYNEVIATGTYMEIGTAPSLGIWCGDQCSGIHPNNLSFAFLNDYSPDAIEDMCGTIAQESAHAYGLFDHAADCRDPLGFGYHGPCGGVPRGFFRDHFVACSNDPVGHFNGTTPCFCGGTQINNHQLMLGGIGPNPDFEEPAPTVTILNPADGAHVDETVTFGVEATAHRGIYGVDVYLNGWPWGTWQAPEEPEAGDRWPIDQMVVDPDNGFPDGLYDVEIRAYDDLGTTATATMTMTKGAPCTSADSCLDGQKCEEGKCFWDQPSGALGDACEIDQQCIGPNVYDGTCETGICTHACFAGPNDNCGEGFECASDNPDGSGFCAPAAGDKPGCCSTGGGGSGALGLTGIVGLLVMRRRRR